MKVVISIRIRTIVCCLLGVLIAAAIMMFFLQNIFEQEKRERCYQTLLTFCSRIEKNVPDNAVVFIGDSLVHGLCVAAVAPYSVNLGIGRDSTTGVLHRLKQYASLGKVGAVIVAVGVNDIIQKKQNGIVKRYEGILGVIPGHVPIILCAVFPVDEEKTVKVKNGEIYLLNIQIASACSKYINCYYSELNDKLMDVSGNLASKYHIGDGVHLNAQGNQIWIDELNNILADI